MEDFKNIIRPIEAELKIVRRELERHVKQLIEENEIAVYKDFINKSCRHIFNKSGKFLRSAILILISKSLNIDKKYRDLMFGLSSVIELTHSASLIHDDIIDNSSMRRSHLSVNEAFGNKVEVLAGDLVFTKAFSCIVQMNFLDFEHRITVLKTFIDLIYRMCFGEIIEANCMRSNESPGFATYMDIIRNKTACLFGNGVRVFLEITGFGKKICGSFYEYCINTGLAYQLSDDLDDDDSPVDSKKHILSHAKKCIIKARQTIDFLEESSYKKALYEIGDFILRRMGK